MSQWNWASTWPAPAKLNLFLHVVGRRADGYHLLQTVFRFIDNADQLRFSAREDGEIVLATPIPGVAPETDLTVRAALLLQKSTGCPQGATIHLQKNLFPFLQVVIENLRLVREFVLYQFWYERINQF